MIERISTARLEAEEKALRSIVGGERSIYDALSHDNKMRITKQLDLTLDLLDARREITCLCSRLGVAA